jgi:hypothetical protein
MSQDWNDLQKAVSTCRRCETKLPDVGVDCPPGRLYPDGVSPPNRLKILFIGVAPPKTGFTFHTDSTDNLWLGLSGVLAKLRRRCTTLAEFYSRGFFLIHTAKCAIRGTTSPDLRVSQLCASTYLSKEIEWLAPEAVCWLSKNVCFPVARAEAKRRGFIGELPFGIPVPLPVAGRTMLCLATSWPGRGWQDTTTRHLESLFAALEVPGMTASDCLLSTC